MFWSTELLSRRDSGFGLAWLAATLGAKSSFSKLPKRSVMAANISQMCHLIAEPPEPLALRLSSNLMIGVTRVYKVKQEILLTDITTCFNMLKRAFQDAYITSSANAQLQMAQPSVRPDTVTLAANPTAVFALDFDNLFADWDERQKGEDDEIDGSDDDFSAKKKGKKGKAKATPMSQVEQGLHTLQEHNDFLLSSSFDASFGSGGLGGLPPSSSQIGGYGYDDNFLEGLDIGADIGAELAKELGEGWGMPVDHLGSDDNANAAALDIEMGLPGDIAPDFQLGADFTLATENNQAMDVGSGSNLKRPFSEVSDDLIQPEDLVTPFSPTASAAQVDNSREHGTKKARRVRRLLDARTELTNEELEKARAHYLEGQAELRREHATRKAEREGMKILEEMVWGAPKGINAPALIRFWEENFKLQVEARLAHPNADIHESARRRRNEPDTNTQDALTIGHELGRGDVIPEGEMNLDSADPDLMNGLEELDLNSRMRSSEEPGLARRGSSRPPSLLGSNFGLGVKHPDSGSQRNNMFPWDNAGGVSSSISGVAFGVGGSDRLSFTGADTRVRRSSSLPKVSLGGVPESPASFLPSDSHAGADVFDLAEHAQPEDVSRVETQASDVSMMSLEKNSSNFLEYMKIQMNALPTGAASLRFDSVVPKDASTRHVAAAAFYHCLVLATKDLVGIQQSKPYSMLRLTVK